MEALRPVGFLGLCLLSLVFSGLILLHGYIHLRVFICVHLFFIFCFNKDIGGRIFNMCVGLLHFNIYSCMYSSPSILQPSILRLPWIIRPLDLFPKGNFLLNDIYFKTTCNIIPHFLGPMGDLKIEGLLSKHNKYT